MSDRHRHLLEATRHRTAVLLRTGNRLLAGILSLGSIFCVLSVLFANLLKQPEQALQVQAFMFNYSDFSQAEQGLPLSSRLKPSQQVKPHDPNWDGVIAGASLGLAIGRDIPVIGLVIGPVIGATLGYQLDSRV